jgi:hypothetical protein
MKRIAIILRFFAISPEFLVSVTGLALFNFWPNWFLWLTERIGQQSELLKYFGLLPAALVVYDSQIVKNILFPDSDKRAILQGWGRYWDLKCGGVVGLVYGIIFAIAGFSALLFDWKKPAAHYAALLITSVLGALTVSASLYFTHIKIEELFRQQPQEKSKGA